MQYAACLELVAAYSQSLRRAGICPYSHDADDRMAEGTLASVRAHGLHPAFDNVRQLRLACFISSLT